MKLRVLKGLKVMGLTIVIMIAGIFSVEKVNASTLYRAYNPNTGEHLYTQNGNEIPFVVKAGWRNEGTAWEAPSKGAPVYRMFNPNRGGDHHYTINSNEVSMLKSKGWRYEGESWKSGGNTPVYRLYNPNAKSGSHHFTTLIGEKNNLVSKGWRYEGIAFYSGKDTNNTQPTEKWTVWYKADIEHSKDLELGSQVFNSRDKAREWIENYADVLLAQGITSANYGTQSWN